MWPPPSRQSTSGGSVSLSVRQGTHVLQREDESKRFVDSLHLGRVEAAGRIAQPLGVHHRRLFDKYARVRAEEIDRGSERRRPCAGGGRRDQRRTQSQLLVGLHNDRVAGAALLTAPRASRCRQTKDLPANHVPTVPVTVRAVPSARG